MNHPVRLRERVLGVQVGLNGQHPGNGQVQQAEHCFIARPAGALGCRGEPIKAGLHRIFAGHAAVGMISRELWRWNHAKPIREIPEGSG